MMLEEKVLIASLGYGFHSSDSTIKVTKIKWYINGNSSMVTQKHETILNRYLDMWHKIKELLCKDTHVLNSLFVQFLE